MEVKFSKRCPMCLAEKPLPEFPRNASAADGRGGYCRPCHAKAAKRSRARSKAKYAEMVALLSPSDRARLGIAD